MFGPGAAPGGDRAQAVPPDPRVPAGDPPARSFWGELRQRKRDHRQDVAFPVIHAEDRHPFELESEHIHKPGRNQDRYRPIKTG